jgi:hypothetical protein
MKFKVGDRVAINNLGDVSNWNDYMIAHANGKVGVVKSIRRDRGYLVQTDNNILREVYRSPYDTTGWWYREDTLSLYDIAPPELFTM